MSAPPLQPARPGFTPWRFGLLLALLIFAAFPQVILGLETFVARDYGFFVYPLAHFQKECFWRGELPFWDPYNNCGVPFLAQWNTMPLYPPSLLYLTLPLRWSLSCFSLLHLWWAGLGMFFLARRHTGNSFAAVFAGTAFAFNGFTLNLLMWPSHIATFSWMPWVVLAVEGAWREGGKKIPVAAFVGAMQMLAGGPETIFLTWLLVLAFWVQQFIAAETPRARMLWRLPVVVGLVIALSAAQLLPFLDLVAHAQRETGYTDLRWSMPGFGLANFLVPMAFGSTPTEGIFFQHGQYWTSSYYLGLGTLWLALLAILDLHRWQQMRDKPPIRVLQFKPLLQFWARFCSERILLLTIVSTVALLCALGENTPFYPLVRRIIPQLSFITYPVKFLMVVVFAAPLLAAFALANLENLRKQFIPLGLALLAAIGGVLVWIQHAPMAGDDSQAAMLNGFTRGAFLIFTGVVLFAMTREIKSPLRQVMPLILILVAWLDVLTHEPNQNPTVQPGIFDLNLARTRLAMQPQPELGGSRAMLSPAAAVGLTRLAVSDPKPNFLAKRIGYCADVNLLDAVPKVDGFFSLSPRDFDGLLTFIYDASNGKWSHLEDFMGVSQYSSPTNFLTWTPRPTFRPLVTAGQSPIFLDDPHTLWNLGRDDFDLASLVFLPPEEKSIVSVTNQTTATVLNAKFSNATVDFQTEAGAPALAVIAQTYYHNWQAEIDGQPAPLLRANLAFQAVQVPAGPHRVHLFYRDRAFETGAAISVCTWVSVIAGYLALRRRQLPPAPTPAHGDYF